MEKINKQFRRKFFSYEREKIEFENSHGNEIRSNATWLYKCILGCYVKNNMVKMTQQVFVKYSFSFFYCITYCIAFYCIVLVVAKYITRLDELKTNHSDVFLPFNSSNCYTILFLLIVARYFQYLNSINLLL